MSAPSRSLLAFVALLGLLAGCTHRPAAPPRDPAPLAGRPAAPDATPVTRRSTPGTPFARAQPAAPFAPLLVVTTQVAHDDLFLHLHPFAPEGPRYQNVVQLHRGQRAFILPLARNYGLDPRSRADLTFETEILRPDGTPDGRPLSSVLWQEAVPSAELTLYPATNIVFYAEPHDPAGIYRITVRVHDHLAGESRALVHAFELIDYVAPSLPADFDPDAWFHGYYLQPSPELALPALPRFFEKLPAAKRAGAVPPLLGFYDQILRDNDWLLPAFAARLDTAPTDEAFALSLVLGFHLRAASSPPPGLSTAHWQRLADFRGHAWPSDPDAPLLHASQLDSLWGRFFASALYAPVQRLLEPLAHTADLGASERWRQAFPSASPEAAPPLPDLDDPATPPEIRREVLLRTALWSLRANARQHPLVRGYLEQSLRAGDLAPGTRLLIERVLRAESAIAVAPAAPRS